MSENQAPQPLDLAELYRQNRGFLYTIARKYARLDPAIDANDLAQVGALALPAAAASYDPECGAKWSTWAAWHIKRAIRDALSIRRKDGKPALPLHATAVSLDAPLPGDADGLTLGDVLPDDAPPLDSGILRAETGKAVRQAVDRLAASNEREAVRLRAYDGMTYRELAKALRITPSQAAGLYARALDRLRHDRWLRKALTLDDATPYYVHVGPTRFNTTFTSATEHAVLWRLDHADNPAPAAPSPMEASTDQGKA